MVSRAGEGLAARFHDIPVRLNHWHYDMFRGDVEDKTLSEVKLFFQFFTDAQGEIERVAVPLEVSVEPGLRSVNCHPPA